MRQVPAGPTLTYDRRLRNSPSSPVPSPPERFPALQASRRQFLRRAGAVAVTLLPAGALWAQAPPRRSLSFVHTHTGEAATSVYFRDGGYVAPELARINWLMRDFRTGDVHPIDTGVLDILSDLRTLADRDAPFEVICGYRSPQTNALLHTARAVSPSTACICKGAPSTCGCRDFRPRACSSWRSA